MVDRVGVGLIGAGGVSRTYIDALAACADVATVVAVADVHSGRAARAGAATGAPAYTDYLDLLGRPDVELVIVLTPPGSHHDIGLAAIAHRKHVCIIKPLTIELADADALIAAADRAGVMLFAAHPYRYDASIRAIRQAIDAGHVGEPVRVYARSFLHAASLAKTDDWYYDLRQCGGLTIETLVHALDLMTWLLGPAVRVYAEAGSYHTRGLPNPLPDDQIVATYRFESGAIGVVEGAAVRPATADGALFEVIGTEGTAWRDAGDPSVVRVARIGERGSGIERRIADHPHRGEPLMLRTFIRCVRDGTPPPISGAAGRYAVELAWAALLSHMRHGPVSLPLTAAAYPTTGDARLRAALFIGDSRASAGGQTGRWGMP